MYIGYVEFRSRSHTPIRSLAPTSLYWTISMNNAIYICRRTEHISWSMDKPRLLCQHQSERPWDTGSKQESKTRAHTSEVRRPCALGLMHSSIAACTSLARTFERRLQLGSVPDKKSGRRRLRVSESSALCARESVKLSSVVSPR